MESSTSFTPMQEDDTSLKHFILKTVEWIKYLWRKRLWLILAGVIGAVLGLFFSLATAPKYKATLSFVLEDSDSNPLGAYAGIASQFGINLGIGGSSGIFSGDNILEFLKSKLMIEKTLLLPVQVNGRKKTLADLYIEMNDLRKSWSRKKGLKNIHFPVSLKRGKFSLQQDSILGVIHKDLLKENLTIVKPDKQLNFIVVECTTKNEVFSKNFVEKLVNEATIFYVKTKTQRSQSTIDRLQGKADSIEALLNQKTYSVASAQDMNLNPARNLARVSTEVAARDKYVLQTIYAEVLKNLEISKMAMAQESPIIQIVDIPTLPLERKKLGILPGMLLGGFLGVFLLILGISSLQAYRKIITQ
ncbi:GumC domain-containing protein [Chitinophaga japonensis]|uniref:Subunit length determinant protein n=1 Tax=Chitinophaga japonensis TaxID=104662 RepID=A0A562TFK9_CHIJA|nr:lipopolysaccharide biosynthesis protein [Chitinophaga japonensis]TWI92054.1 subunit length determinant protein [Chitinophaga japonensis]